MFRPSHPPPAPAYLFLYSPYSCLGLALGVVPGADCVGGIQVLDLPAVCVPVAQLEPLRLRSFLPRRLCLARRRSVGDCYEFLRILLYLNAFSVSSMRPSGYLLDLNGSSSV